MFSFQVHSDFSIFRIFTVSEEVLTPAVTISWSEHSTLTSTTRLANLSKCNMLTIELELPYREIMLLEHAKLAFDIVFRACCIRKQFESCQAGTVFAVDFNVKWWTYQVLSFIFSLVRYQVQFNLIKIQSEFSSNSVKCVKHVKRSVLYSAF